MSRSFGPRLGLSAILLLFVFFATLARGAQSAAVPLAAASGQLVGIWVCGGPQHGAGAPITWSIVNDRGESTPVVLTQEQIRRLGGPNALSGQKATVLGTQAAGAGVIAREIRLEPSANAAGVGPGARAQTGSKPYITILVRFADTTDVTPNPPAFYDQLMGSTYPGLDHYYREVSYDQVNLQGSRTVGWYNLPQATSAYKTPDGLELDLVRILNDAIALADGDVNFPDFSGIQIQFNVDVQGIWWGGRGSILAAYPLTLDGQSRNYAVTWINSKSPSVVAHEIGHNLGAWHSSGAYAETYDSKWDVMSNGLYFEGGFALPSGPITYHKNLYGWLAPGQVAVVNTGLQRTVTLEQLNLPSTQNAFLMARTGVDGSQSRFYTVEYRRTAGYDLHLPASCVIIHSVDTSRPDRQAQVVDPDGNGDPNDASAQWTAGETFSDPAGKVEIQVVSISGSSAVVQIRNNGTPLPPDKPINLTATAVSTSEIRLTWEDPGGYGVNFKIERSTGGSPYGLLATIPDPGTALKTYSDQSLAPGTTYQYRVRGSNSVADSAPSDPAAATTLAGAPQNLAARAVSSSSVELSWSAPTGGFVAATYEIERSLDGTTFTNVLTAPGSATTARDSGLTPERPYSYRIRATANQQVTAYSSVASATPLAAPSELTTRLASSSQLELRWRDNSALEQGVYVERSPDGGVFSQVAALGANSVSYVDSGLASNALFYYRVRAFASNSESDPSTAAVGGSPPAAPVSLAVQPASDSQLNLTWTDGNATPAQHRIERSEAGGSFVEIGVAAPGTAAYSDRGLRESTTYTYRVRASNAAGASDYSGVASGTTLTPPPGAPRSLRATAESSTRISLTWTPDGGGETGFKIYRKQGSADFAQVASVGAGVTAYTDGELSARTGYTYTVVATNVGGESARSNEAFVATPAEAAGQLVVARKVDFGRGRRRRARTRTLVVRNGSTTDFLRVHVGSTTAPFAVVSGGGEILLPPQSEHSVTLSFTPSRRGKAQGVLSITSSDSSRSQVSVKLVGVGR